ncbi:MAG TPA: hypothetical protein VNR40_22455 [Steroidobacter sp.]|nr:hypothetical protein [Steroidobacter sp.]
MAKRFPLEILISATDKATAVLNRLSERFEKLTQPFSRLRKAFDGLAERSGIARVGDALRGVGSSIAAVSRRVAFATSLATGALGALIYRQLQASDAIGDTAARLNISTDALQAYQYGFGQADVSAESFTSALDTLNQGLGLAKIGMGKALPLFRGLAIDPKKFRTLDELLPALADRLSRISDPTKRAAIATKLLGDAGAQMALKLVEGPKALDEMGDAARKAGAIIRTDAITAAGKFDQTMNKLRSTLKGVAGNALGKLTPALDKIAEAFGKAIIDNQPKIEAFAEKFADNLPDALEKAGAAFETLQDVLKKLDKAFQWCSDKIGTTNTVIGILAVVAGGPVIGALATLTAAVMRLGLAFAVAFPIPTIIALAVIAIWQLWKNWDKVSAWIGDKLEWLGDFFESVWDKLPNGLKRVLRIIKALWDGSPLGLLFRSIGAVFDHIQAASGPGAGAATPTAPPVGGRLLGPLAGPRQQVDVRVDLSNLPPGTRAIATASEGIGFELSRGYAMPGATGSW